VDLKRRSDNLSKILEHLDPEDREFIAGLIDKDPLTGVYNRRKFDSDLELVIAMADRSNKGTSLLMIDIDHFKTYNDRFGHQKGDAVLQQVTGCISDSLREYDKTHLYRYGGEEFVVLLPDVTDEEAIRIGNRVRKSILNCSGISVSIGVSHYQNPSDTLQSLINNAEKALYEAKKKGRNRVEVFSPEIP
jgi:diguanylate cyclase (GGDEF)-like protein